MEVRFTLDIPIEKLCEGYGSKMENPKNPTLKDMKTAAKLYFYDFSNDELLYNCDDENIEIVGK